MVTLTCAVRVLTVCKMHNFVCIKGVLRLLGNAKARKGENAISDRSTEDTETQRTPRRRRRVETGEDCLSGPVASQCLLCVLCVSVSSVLQSLSRLRVLKPSESHWEVTMRWMSFCLILLSLTGSVRAVGPDANQRAVLAAVDRRAGEL